MDTRQTALASFTPNQLPSVTRDAVKNWTQRPLLQLPDEWRPVVWDFWSFWSLQLKDGMLALASRLRHWIKNDNLTLAEAQAAFDKITKVGGSGECVYGHQVLARLDEVIQQTRKAKAEREANEAVLRQCREGFPKAAPMDFSNRTAMPIHQGKQ